jgi:hypothetical protein
MESLSSVADANPNSVLFTQVGFGTIVPDPAPTFFYKKIFYNFYTIFLRFLLDKCTNFTLWTTILLFYVTE